jgi:hypothetical protein
VPGELLQHVAHEVHPATLPAGPRQDLRDRPPQPLVGIRDHQPHPSQPPPHQLPQELRPELVGLAGPYVEPQDFPGPVLTYPNGYHRRHVYHPAVVAHPHRLRVQPHIRILPLQRPTPKPLHRLVQLPADPGDLAPAAALQPQGSDQVVYLPGAHPRHVRLLHHAHQRPLRPPAGLQQAREVAPLPQLGNPQGDLPHPGLPDPLPVPIPVRLALRSPLVPARPHLLRHLQFHQRLRQQPHPLPQHVQGPVPLVLAQQLQQCHPEFRGRRWHSHPSLRAGVCLTRREPTGGPPRQDPGGRLLNLHHNLGRQPGGRRVHWPRGS